MLFSLPLFVYMMGSSWVDLPHPIYDKFNLPRHTTPRKQNQQQKATVQNQKETSKGMDKCPWTNPLFSGISLCHCHCVIIAVSSGEGQKATESLPPSPLPSSSAGPQQQTTLAAKLLPTEALPPRQEAGRGVPHLIAPRVEREG